MRFFAVCSIFLLFSFQNAFSEDLTSKTDSEESWLTSTWHGEDFIKPADGEFKKELSILLENDKFMGSIATDQYYTQGVKAEYRYFGSVENAGQKRVDYGLTFGQNIYTPKNILLPNPLPAGRAKAKEYDRPYAGWLYLSFFRETYSKKDDGAAAFSVRKELFIGSIGKAALGGTIQNWWHTVIAIKRATGWHNQIGSEFVLQWREQHIADRSYSAYMAGGSKKFFELASVIGYDIGNLMVDGFAGGIARLGWLDDRFATKKQELYLFLDLRGKAVFYNALIEGRMTNKLLQFGKDDPYTVTADRLVFSGKLGVILEYDNFSASFTLNAISPETNSGGQLFSDVTTQKYGSIRAAYRW